jgi:hypothetical protein
MPTSQTSRFGWVVIPALVVVGWLFLLASGVDAAQSLRLVVVVALQGLAGGIVWQALRSGPVSVVEQAGAGLAVGTVMSMVAGVTVTTLGWGTWGWLVPVVPSLAWWIVTRRRRVGNMDSIDGASLVGLAVTFVIGLGSLVPNLLSYPLSWTGTWSRYHPDMLFFESLSTSLSRLGPLDSIYTPDGMVRYHWLVYAWSGQVTAAADAGPFVVLTRVLPFVAVVGSSFLAIAWARRLSTIVWVPSLAVVLLVMGGYVGATYGAIFNFDSPSQSFTTLWLLALAFAVVLLLSSGTRALRSVPTYGVVGILSFGVAGGKVSAGAIAVCAVAWVALVGLARREAWARRGLTVAIVTFVAFVLGYLLVVSGSADPGGLKLGSLLNRASSIQGINPIPGSIGIALGTLILTLAIAVRWAGLAWFLADRDRRWEPSTVIGVGLGIGGVATVLLISGGMNDTWFALAASAPLAVISAAGAGEASRLLGPSRWRPIIWAALAAGLIFIVVRVLWSTGASGGTVWVGTLRWAGPIVGVLAALVVGWMLARTYGEPGSRLRAWLAGSVIVLVLLAAPGRLLGVGSDQVGVQPGLGADEFTPIEAFTEARDVAPVVQWSDQHQAAARWLRDRASGSDLIATNVTFSPLVPALTRMQTLASGILYQAPYGRPDAVAPLLEREAQSWGFIDEPSADTAAALCAAGVTWVWVDPTRTAVRDWMPYASVELATEGAIVLRLDAAACPPG